MEINRFFIAYGYYNEPTLLMLAYISIINKERKEIGNDNFDLFASEVVRLGKEIIAQG